MPNSCFQVLVKLHCTRRASLLVYIHVSCAASRLLLPCCSSPHFGCFVFHHSFSQFYASPCLCHIRLSFFCFPLSVLSLSFTPSPFRRTFRTAPSRSARSFSLILCTFLFSFSLSISWLASLCAFLHHLSLLWYFSIALAWSFSHFFMLPFFVPTVSFYWPILLVWHLCFPFSYCFPVPLSYTVACVVIFCRLTLSLYAVVISYIGRWSLSLSESPFNAFILTVSSPWHRNGCEILFSLRVLYVGSLGACIVHPLLLAHFLTLFPFA